MSSQTFKAIKLNGNDSIAILLQATPHGALVQIEFGGQIVDYQHFIIPETLQSKGSTGAFHKIAVTECKSGS